ncbi:unnamed protein product [Camellia sinensis]
MADPALVGGGATQQTSTMGEENPHKEEEVGKRDLPRFIEQKTRRKRKGGRKERGGRRPNPPPPPKQRRWLKP